MSGPPSNRFRFTSVLQAPATCAVILLARLAPAFAQDAVGNTDTSTSAVVVTGAELPSAYGAPPAFSRTRFSPTTTAYVLPPGAFMAATIYEGNALRRGKPDHYFSQEIEVGLPYRFGIAAELRAESYNGDRSVFRTVSLEARYALADWNKIPLNPTLFVEYKFGTGNVLRDEALGAPEGEAGPTIAIQKMTSRLSGSRARAQESAEEGPVRQPDAVEGRLLLGQDFGEHIEWALNGFFEQDIGGDRGREWGFAQSVMTPLTRNEWLKVGVEMLYTEFSDKGIRDDPEHRFVIGPSFGWKPNRWSRLDVSPLFGVTETSPRAQVFVVFSMLFGGPRSGEAEAPASTRNR